MPYAGKSPSDHGRPIRYKRRKYINKEAHKEITESPKFKKVISKQSEMPELKCDICGIILSKYRQQINPDPPLCKRHGGK